MPVSDPKHVRDTAVLRKARGAFFTPPELCDFLSRWAIRASHDRVLEPSCGEAAFLVSAGRRLASVGASEVGAQLFGVELHEESASTALGLVRAAGLDATVSVGDFFDASLPAGAFDAVVGNPPYVRYQDFTGEARAKAQEAALAEGVRLTGLASSWAGFVVHASSFLNAHGRLALVLPAELMSVNYAAEVRAFLLRRFASVRLVAFEQRVFPGVTEEVVLLLAEGTGPTDHFELYLADGLDDLPDLNGTSSRWAPLEAEGKWLGALLVPDAAEVFAQVARSDHFEPLASWGDPDLGMVTGNNAYFALTRDDVRRLRLRETELVPISPPGSRHLRGLTFSSARWETMLAEGSRGYLFSPDAQRPSKAARTYIAQGEDAGVHKAYKCRVREPWWRVPLTPVPDLFLTYMNHDAPRLVTNRARVRHVNSVHGLLLKRDRRSLGMGLLPLAMLNSATLLGAELVGRSYGGGILKLEPREADVWPVPSVQAVTDAASALRAIRRDSARHLANGRVGEVVDLVDEALLRTVVRMDTHSIGLLREARSALFARRVARKG